jgi:hypothetical protein
MVALGVGTVLVRRSGGAVSSSFSFLPQRPSGTFLRFMGDKVIECPTRVNARHHLMGSRLVVPAFDPRDIACPSERFPKKTSGILL